MFIQQKHLLGLTQKAPVTRDYFRAGTLFEEVATRVPETDRVRDNDSEPGRLHGDKNVRTWRQRILLKQKNSTVNACCKIRNVKHVDGNSSRCSVNIIKTRCTNDKRSEQ